MQNEYERCIENLKSKITFLLNDDDWNSIKIDPTNAAGKRANEYLIQANADLIRAIKNLEKVVV